MRAEVRTPDAPAAIGPYSQGMRFTGEGLVMTAGQLGMDPQSGALVAGGIGPECERALKNLRAVLQAAGSGMDRVVKVTVFLADMGEFAEMNGVYERFFEAPFPARSAFQVAALPKGGRVEIEALAVSG
ncbi:MAG: RidA family protein [Candidatus Eisenbacteria sp.]|nr:RidA family protein [Candidatus Eisenbacteria bacterium]